MSLSLLKLISELEKDYLEQHELDESIDDTYVFEYFDAYLKEVITIDETSNKWGVIKYRAWIEQYDIMDEIYIPEVIAQHGYDFNEYYDIDLDYEDILYEQLLARKINELEISAREQIDFWERQKGKRVDFHGSTLQLTYAIDEHKCYLNIPHYHLFKGYTVFVETHNTNEIRAAIILRDLLIRFLSE